uniref:Uncharacterized protein n=1 Tax=Meloidogyne enterolobii TaxID=390850 RepID=A0A6V7X3L2_MELEN|nr:unnamed protein product [Meloidogyne enterolobii]
MRLLFASIIQRIYLNLLKHLLFWFHLWSSAIFSKNFFQLLGLFMVASVFSLILTIVIALLVTWTYSRYSGHLRDAQKTIDTFVNLVHGNFILPAFATAMGNATLDIAMGSNSTFTTMPSNSTSSTSEEKKKK